MTAKPQTAYLGSFTWLLSHQWIDYKHSSRALLRCEGRRPPVADFPLHGPLASQGWQDTDRSVLFLPQASVDWSGGPVTPVTMGVMSEWPLSDTMPSSCIPEGESESWFLEHLALVNGIIEAIARRHCLGSPEADEFAAWARGRLMDNDYAIIRKFQGRASIKTYLSAVLANLYRDFRNSVWGRWRPSAEATRLGPVAIRLEQLLYRDGMSMREASGALSSAGCRLSDVELARMAARLPSRPRDREVALDASLVATNGDLDRVATERERLLIQTALQRAVAELGDEDRLILRMRYWDEVSVANIARSLHIEQKPLYRRLERLQDLLKTKLETRGVSRELAMDTIAESTLW